MSVLKFKCSKLVRDKILDELEKQGVKPHYLVVDDSSNCIILLKMKLVEEVEELILAKSKPEIILELCDLYDVLAALHHLFGFIINDSDILRIKGSSTTFDELRQIAQDALSLENYNEYFIKIAAVLSDIMRNENISKQEVIEARKDKNEKFGGFLLGIFLDYVEVSTDNYKAIQYFKAQPTKYPIMK